MAHAAPPPEVPWNQAGAPHLEARRGRRLTAALPLDAPPRRSSSLTDHGPLVKLCSSRRLNRTFGTLAIDWCRPCRQIGTPYDLLASIFDPVD